MNFHRICPSRFAATATALAAAGALLAGGPARADYDSTYSAGHADIGVSLEGDGGTPNLSLHYHFGPNTVIDGTPLGGGLAEEGYEYDPSLIRVIVPDQALVTIPPGGGLPFLGLGAGESLWILPQVNNPLLPFLGIATEDLDDADWASPITFAVTGFSGPGRFSMWQDSPFGGQGVFWNTSDGSIVGDSYTPRAIGSHDHANFGFTAPGLYDLTLTASGTHRDLGLLSDSATFRFVVGTPAAVVPEPASLALCLAGAGGLLLARSWRRGPKSPATPS